MKMLGQGATEYLVLLAVVLIVALVSVALLGFFPGMASDAQITQSQAYWQGASPIAVSEVAARHSVAWGSSVFSMKLTNMGVYPIRITKIVGGAGCWANQTIRSPYKVDYYLGAGEEAVIGDPMFGSTEYPVTVVKLDSVGGNCNGGIFYLYAAKSVCQNSNSSPGTLVVPAFGFEYIAYIDGQQITKRQIGKELIIKCREPY